MHLEHFNLNLSHYKLDSNYNVMEFANHKTSTYNITFFLHARYIFIAFTWITCSFDLGHSPPTSVKRINFEAQFFYNLLKWQVMSGEIKNDINDGFMYTWYLLLRTCRSKPYMKRLCSPTLWTVAAPPYGQGGLGTTLTWNFFFYIII